MKLDKYSIYILIIVGIVAIVALTGSISNNSDLAGEARSVFENKASVDVQRDHRQSQETEPIELLQDLDFELGFTEFEDGNLYDYEECEMPVTGQDPFWRITEVAVNTHFCKNLPNPKSENPNIVYESTDGHKKLTSYKDGRVRLELNSYFEENQGCEADNPFTPWLDWIIYGVRSPDLLIDFEDYEELNFNVDVKLNDFSVVMPTQDCTEDDDPSSVQRYNTFLIVFMLRSKNTDFDDDNDPNVDFYMLISPCEKHWWEGDISGNKECTSPTDEYFLGDPLGVLIYHPPMNGEFPLLEEGVWKNYDLDIKEMANNALDFWNSEYGENKNLEDFELGWISFDWEMVGAFYTDVELKDISLEGIPMAGEVVCYDPDHTRAEDGRYTQSTTTIAGMDYEDYCYDPDGDGDTIDLIEYSCTDDGLLDILHLDCNYACEVGEGRCIDVQGCDDPDANNLEGGIYTQSTTTVGTETDNPTEIEDHCDVNNPNVLVEGICGGFGFDWIECEHGCLDGNCIRNFATETEVIGIVEQPDIETCSFDSPLQCDYRKINSNNIVMTIRNTGITSFTINQVKQYFIGSTGSQGGDCPVLSGLNIALSPDEETDIIVPCEILENYIGLPVEMDLQIIGRTPIKRHQTVDGSIYGIVG